MVSLLALQLHCELQSGEKHFISERQHHSLLCTTDPVLTAELSVLMRKIKVWKFLYRRNSPENFKKQVIILENNRDKSTEKQYVLLNFLIGKKGKQQYLGRSHHGPASPTPREQGSGKSEGQVLVT